MRKRFISGLTALCMLGILLANSFLAVPASAVIAEVGASVAAGLLMGTLFNQMTGGTGYDFTDAFADCFSFATKPHNQFIRDNPDADIYLPDGTPYYVDGQYVTGIDLKKKEAEIAASIQSHWNIAESLGIKTPQETIHAAMEAFNAGLADGSIVIHVDDDGNISMPTTSWCNAVTDVYESFGCYKSKDGSKRAQTLYSVISPYVYANYNGWSISSNAVAQWESETYGKPSSGRFMYFVPYFIADSKLHIMRFSVRSSTISAGFSTVQYKTENIAQIPSLSGWNEYYDKIEDLFFSSSTTITLKSDQVQYSVDAGFNFSSDTVTQAISSEYQISYSGKSTDDFDVIQGYGFCVVSETDFTAFCSAAKQGTLEQNKETVSIPLTGVENTIGNMGLAGVGSGATKGTVSVNSKTKDITVTNEATKEAELVIEQGNAGDIDLPDNDTIIDKFPFSLPFDLYRILTIFVVPEQKPIFTFPIETTITNGGLNYKIDEEIKVDLTRFQFMGQDIVRLVLRSTFYVGFVIMLIHVTSKFIKH